MCLVGYSTPERLLEQYEQSGENGAREVEKGANGSGFIDGVVIGSAFAAPFRLRGV